MINYVSKLVFAGLLPTLLATVPATADGPSARSAMQKAPQGQPANRWRYLFYEGRWWYWKPNAQWSYFDGRRWVDLGIPLTGVEFAEQAPPAAAQPKSERSLHPYGMMSLYPPNYSPAIIPDGGRLLPNLGTGLYGTGVKNGLGLFPYYGTSITPGGNLLPNLGVGLTDLGVMRSFGSDTIAGAGVGVGSETGSRSGDAGSGVGGGSVGGANIGGWFQPR